MSDTPRGQTRHSHDRSAGIQESRVPSGPLRGFRILEFAGIGPSQLCGMLLADLGAEVLRIARREDVEAGLGIPPRYDLMNRSRPSISVDLKSAAGRNLAGDLLAEADALFEGFRPGVMERLGLGPEVCLRRNPKLIYGRVTGWGQDGPLAQRAGHDPNYIGLAGVLASIGEKDGPPVYPLNLIGDFGGGALYLAFGLLAALLEASRSGKGQVVDAAMLDGVASMATFLHGMKAGGLWREQRGGNVVNAGGPQVHVYRTKDGQYMVAGAVEGKFFANMLAVLGIDADPAWRNHPKRWPELTQRIQARFLTKTRAEWTALFEAVDSCVSPVLTLTEATKHPQAKARGLYETLDGITQPAPAPRFSRTPGAIRSPPAVLGKDNAAALAVWGFDDGTVRMLEAKGVLGLAAEPRR